jgi:hypothetical protein
MESKKSKRYYTKNRGLPFVLKSKKNGFDTNK